jgi:hypothetical protein
MNETMNFKPDHDQMFERSTLFEKKEKLCI